jgi:hypothetical protein
MTVNSISQKVSIDCLGQLMQSDGEIQVEFYKEGGGALEVLHRGAPFPAERLKEQEERPLQCVFWGDPYWAYDGYVLQIIDHSATNADSRAAIMDYIFSLRRLLPCIEQGRHDDALSILLTHNEISKASLKKSARATAATKVISLIDRGDFFNAMAFFGLFRLDMDSPWLSENHATFENRFKRWIRQGESIPERAIFDGWYELRLGESVFENDRRALQNGTAAMLRLIEGWFADESSARVLVREIANEGLPVTITRLPKVQNVLRTQLRRLFGTMTDGSSAVTILEGVNRIFHNSFNLSELL